jgi:alkyl sulfatase BDS1-like metallo-beta-lactamase superfamily hydrolase
MFPASRKERGADILALCGRDAILAKARALKDAADLKRALALAEIALNANPSDYEAMRVNAEILEAMASSERSFIARNFFAGAARQLRERAKQPI